MVLIWIVKYQSILRYNHKLRCINPDSTITWAHGNTWGLFSVKIIGVPTHDSSFINIIHKFGFMPYKILMRKYPTPYKSILINYFGVNGFGDSKKGTRTNVPLLPINRWAWFDSRRVFRTRQRSSTTRSSRSVSYRWIQTDNRWSINIYRWLIRICLFVNVRKF